MCMFLEFFGKPFFVSENGISSATNNMVDIGELKKYTIVCWKGADIGC